ncbi:GDP-mannose 4,6-dehydratase [Sulfobacillus thermosulfidooxidans]|uniref:GDP-mannose 4,6-dehydratase n=1 Tax=Sulfobacillus thermosulfidooxidans TaxID=28034 RepID=UPI0002EB5B40|nr:GDP-mannose 4,6-dehydratase [Sulfobacillus thermosulfidooxidans]
MHVLVTGGAGFIGANLVREALEQGHEVCVIDNLSSGHIENLQEVQHDIRFVEGDIRNADLLAQIVCGMDIIYHMAASVGNQRSIDNPYGDADINLMGTIRILEAARMAGVKKVVLASSAGILGEPAELPVTETHAKNPDSPYGVSKMAAEAMALVYEQIYELPTVALRYFNAYGPLQRYDAYGNVIPIFARRILRHEPLNIFGDGEQTRDFIHVADLVKVTLKAGTLDHARGIYHIGSGQAVSINQLVQLMEQIFYQEVRVRYLPPRPGDVRHSLAGISRAVTDLGYQVSYSLEEGLKDYRDWLLEEAFGACGS